jgi:uroporphyrin-III C-methyltransferase
MILNSKTPRVTLVGAGPGDADLITLKGLKALQQADVVLYDALVNDELLEYAPVDAVKVFVGKRSGDHSYSQEAVNKLMVDYAFNYGHVVRLKGGDPFVFGRGFEELEYAAQHNLPVTVVPGISSSISVPGLQNVPVTHRGLSESFWVVTGTTADGALSADLIAAAQSNATVVVLMGIKKLPQIVEVFKAAGKQNLPAMAIQNGSTSNEKVAVATVDSIVETVNREGIDAPALLVFGEVVSLHNRHQPAAIVHDARSN